MVNVWTCLIFFDPDFVLRSAKTMSGSVTFAQNRVPAPHLLPIFFWGVPFLPLEATSFVNDPHIALPLRSKSSKSRLTLSFSWPMNVKVHCMTCCKNSKLYLVRLLSSFDYCVAIMSRILQCANLNCSLEKIKNEKVQWPNIQSVGYTVTENEYGALTK